MGTPRNITFAANGAPASELRSTPGNTSDFWYQIISGLKNGSGQSVSAEQAERLSPVYACVTAIAETVAMIPVNIFRQVDEHTKTPATGHYLWNILKRRPNKLMTAFQFFETLQRHLLYRGNAYCLIVENDKTGRIEELLPLHPNRVTPKVLNDSEVEYHYLRPDGQTIAFSKRLIFHIANQSEDGIIGRSPIQAVADSVGFGLNLLEHGNALFANGARPDGVLKLEGNLRDKEAVDRLRSQWEEIHGGAANSGKIAVLEGGAAYEPIAMNMRDAQFIEARKFSQQEVAQIFRVPPHMIQDLERATFSNIEEQSINFVRYTIQPWLKRWEHAIETQLIPLRANDLFVRFQTNSLLRGDFKTRTEGYASAIQNGYMSRDEVRNLEDMNPIPEGKGEEFLIPLNLGVAGEDPADQEPAASDVDEERGLEFEKRVDTLFDDIFIRLITKEANAVKRKLKSEAPLKSLNDFYEKHQSTMREQLIDVCEIIQKDSGANVERFIELYCSKRVDSFVEVLNHSEPDALRFVVNGFRRETTFWAKELKSFVEGSEDEEKRAN